jgi:hypothetical protein
MSIYTIVPTPGVFQCPVRINGLVWVKLWDGLRKDFLEVPMRVVDIHYDGTWDGELSEGWA